MVGYTAEPLSNSVWIGLTTSGPMCFGDICTGKTIHDKQYNQKTTTLSYPIKLGQLRWFSIQRMRAHLAYNVSRMETWVTEWDRHKWAKTTYTVLQVDTAWTHTGLLEFLSTTQFWEKGRLLLGLNKVVERGWKNSAICFIMAVTENALATSTRSYSMKWLNCGWFLLVSQLCVPLLSVSHQLGFWRFHDRKKETLKRS